MDRIHTHRQRVAQKNLKAIWLSKRKELDLTQEKAAAEPYMGMTQANVSHYINGHAALNVESVLKFAKLLQVHPTEIDPELADLLPGQPPSSQPPKGGIHEEIESLSPEGKRLVRIAIRLAQGGEDEDLLRSRDEK